MKTISNGVWPTMVTPFTADNKIDYGGVERLLHWYWERGVAGVFAISQSSEIFFLSFEEKKELLRFINAHKPKDMEIIASGHTANDLTDQIEEAKAYVDIGTDAYVFITNRLARQTESDDIFLKNLEVAVRALPDVGLGFYECPFPYKRLLSPKLICEIASWGAFQFLKDTSCDVNQMKAKLAAMAGSNMRLFNANSATFLETLKLGASGYSGVMANFHPELYVWLWKNFKQRPELAQFVQNIIGFFSVAECQNYPVNAKYYLGLEGLDIGFHTRSKDPTEFTPNRQMEIAQMREVTLYLEEQLPLSVNK